MLKLDPTLPSSRSALRPSILALGAALLLLLSGSAVAASGPDEPEVVPEGFYDGWHENAAGMVEAVKLQEETGKPLFVYFYASWCGYCKQFDRVLLTDDKVKDYLDEVIAVRIDTESGPESVQLKRMYQVRGTPSIFMHSNRTKTVSKVNRMEMKDGRPRLLEADDFVKELRNAASR